MAEKSYHSMMHLACTSFCTPRSIRQRKRRTIETTFNDKKLHVFLLCSILFRSSFYVHSAVWTNGPEDSFFCGFKWDDPDCQKRQHCPTGNSDDCEGNEEGVKCFANTNCDTRYADGDWFNGAPPKQSPGGTGRPTYGGKSDNKSDHYWCGVGLDDARNKCGTKENHCPGGAASECPPGNICFPDLFSCDARNIVPPTAFPTSEPPTRAPAVAGPTTMPTDMPFGAPDPLPYPSDNPSDHWFCGIGLDNANIKCEVHCPTALECPLGNICYFGTQCDGRTHSPTPPPTRRPTTHPTPLPTLNPTFTMPPTHSPTFTSLPTDVPSEQGPTMSPTPSPTRRPSYPPMPSLQSSFFCGTSWDDAITHCKRKCPTGESTECPFDEKCFSLTPCTEELGYPEEYGLTGGGVVGGGGSEGGEACVPFTVSIVADHWPKETSWLVENTELGDIIAEADDNDLVPGEPVQWVECLNNKNGCYEFTINDSGGDGICCGHGNGSYKISYDGVELAQGSAFYEFEKTPFGLCGAAPDTEIPTKEPIQMPTEAPKNNPESGGAISNSGGNSGESAFRCVANSLIEAGYEISRDYCELFADCFNKYINVGDDFFCDGTNEQCVEASTCGVKEDNPADEAIAPPIPIISSSPTDRPMSSRPTGRPTSSSPSVRPTSNVPASRPKVARPKPEPKPKGPKPPDISKTKSKSPTPSPVAANPLTEAPTLIPSTYRPTYGPCDGTMCNQKNHCRSRYGFCGPGDTYCNDNAIWTNDCRVPEPSSHPSQPPVSESPINTPVTLTPTTLTPTDSIPVSGSDNLIETTELPTARSLTTMRPSKKPSGGFKKPSGGFKKPSGGKGKPRGGKGKPGGGKGSLSNPTSSFSPITYSPTKRPTKMPIEVILTTRGPTVNPSPSPTSTSPTTASPSPWPTHSPSHWPSEAPLPAPITSAPTTEATFKQPISLSEPHADYPLSETKPEVDTIDKNVGLDDSETNNVPLYVLDTSSKDDEDEFGCTGDPCPVDTHCRSRYGSCGPGFIYCNNYSIWRKSCPPIVPGTRPTRTPTARPTKHPITARPTKSPITVVVQEPTFPPFAKPSLPTINGITPFTPPSSFSTTDQMTETNKAENSKNNTEEKLVQSDDPQDDLPKSNTTEERSQSEEYLDESLDEWAAGRMARIGAACPRPKSGLNVFSAAITLIFYICIT